MAVQEMLRGFWRWFGCGFFAAIGLFALLAFTYAISAAAIGREPNVLDLALLVGGLCLLAAATIHLDSPRASWRVAMCGFLLVGVPVFAGWLEFQAERRARREVDLVVSRWIPTTDSATTYPDWNRFPTPPGLLGPFDRLHFALARQLADTGRLAPSRLRRFGEGPPIRVVILMTHPVSSTVELPQPDRGTLMYVQSGDSWIEDPPNTPTIARKIRLSPNPEEPNHVIIAVEQPARTWHTAAIYKFD